MSVSWLHINSSNREPWSVSICCLLQNNLINVIRRNYCNKKYFQLISIIAQLWIWYIYGLNCHRANDGSAPQTLETAVTDPRTSEPWVAVLGCPWNKCFDHWSPGTMTVYGPLSGPFRCWGDLVAVLQRVISWHETSADRKLSSRGL